MPHPRRSRYGSSTAVVQRSPSTTSSGSIVLTSRSTFNDEVDAVNRAASGVNSRLRALSDAIGEYFDAPSASRVEDVETVAASVRVELARLAGLRNELGAGGKAREIADSHFENAKERYGRELLRVQNSVPEDDMQPPSPSVSSGYQDQLQSQYERGASPEQIAQARDVAERTKELKRLQKAFQGINTLMEELSVIVVNQGETLEAVDKNVEETALHVDVAYAELSRARRLKNKIRRKKILVGLAVGVVVIIGTVVVILLLV